MSRMEGVPSKIFRKGEPEYEEVKVEGMESSTLVTVFDPSADEVVGVIDVNMVEVEYDAGTPVSHYVKPVVGQDDEELFPYEEKA